MEAAEGAALPTVPGTTDAAGVDVCEVKKAPKGGEAWSIDFSLPKLRRKSTKKEREAILCSKLRSQYGLQQVVSTSELAGTEGSNQALMVGSVADSEGNRLLQTVVVDDMFDASSLIPRDLPTRREDLEKRVCFRIPRLLAIAKQYPKSCGVTSLTSVWNYLYSRIGENPAASAQPPVSQEEVMSILGFAPPFDSISWGQFTGNGTLIRWFHALNRHFGLKGRAYVLYKPQGAVRTTCTAEEALRQVKDVLKNPLAALIYHCHNHYMLPIGYQDIPHAQSNCYAPNVPESSCDTTIFIGEVSRGRHEALYARKWSDVVKDLTTQFPQFYNIRRPELGIQTRVSKKHKEGNAQAQKQAEEVIEGNAETKAVDDCSGKPSMGDQPEEGAVSSSFSGVPAPEEDREAPPATQSRVRRKVKAFGRNLHCLICFRCDQVEERPERFEVSSTSSDREDSTSSSDSGAAPNDGEKIVE
uniref:Uncharacterized protein n=1 Tax=Trypanosoma congolense (strain IL3000) TaxID=1068625 RepID=G0UQF8_TRYCI|nr:conserved hypothetical protein [Trypanosoma congolense IL3000]